MSAFSCIREVAARAVPAVLMARFGLPALGALVFLVILVVGSDARTERVCRVLLAWRGNASCLAPGGTAAPVPPVPRPRRRPWLRRS